MVESLAPRAVTLEGVDPITFQILRHKFSHVTAEAIAALKNVSGTANTNVAHDMMVSLYGTDGSLTIGGAGYAHHLPPGAQAVKHLIEHFSDDPGIHEDDAFFFNDPYSGALHAPDVFIISPIFYAGTLRGFVANFVHVTDIGGIDSGGFCPNARECYQEGFMTKGLKIVEGGTIRRDVFDTFLNMVRDPGMTALDLKSQLAANHVAKERMVKLYHDYGPDTVDAVSHELIRQSERLLRDRLRELPDGSWRSCEYVDIDGARSKVELTAIKDGDTLTYDFTGSSPQVPLGINCSYWATWGAMFAPLFPLLAWDIMWNEGVTRPIRMIAPEGTVVNCSHPGPLSIATVGIILSVNNVSNMVLAKMMGASERYKDRVTAIWRGTGTRLQLHGFSRNGQYFSAPLTDTWAGSGGATPFKDGVDAAGEIPNVVSAMGNVETHELITPILYLYRRLVPDSVGAGRFRGGMSHEYAFTPHGSDGPVGIVAKGKGTTSPMSLGIFGGYPGCNVHYYTFRDGNAAELPWDLASTAGATRDSLPWGTFDLDHGDVQYICAMGGGGYGDPLERDPDAVLSDVLSDVVGADVARRVYGVVIDYDAAAVDRDATAAARASIRARRVGRDVAPELAVRAVIAPTGRRINEYLQATADGAVQCTWCGGIVAPSGRDWKSHAVVLSLPVGELGPMHVSSDEFVIVETFCPYCGTLLDADVGAGDDPPRQDVIVGVEAGANHMDVSAGSSNTDQR
jgi:N-methylhydantoinase B